MKILLLSHYFYPQIGGIEINSELLAIAFHNHGHEVRLLTWSADPGNKHFDYTIIRQPDVKTLLKQHMWADVVFENNPCLRLAWPAYFLRKPSVVALCTWVSRSDGTSAWQDKLKLRWLKRADKVIAVSNAIKEVCFPPAVVIGNPYGVDIFKTLPAVQRNLDFVFLGRLVSDKGADLAIEAIHQLKEESIKFTLTIVGDGDEMLPLKKMVEDYQLQDLVTFTGALRGDVLVRKLNEHKYMLVPSRWKEPFGNVALEGMACGCLPIVADGGGLPDAVGEAGIVFERGSVDSLVNAIKNLRANVELEKSLRAKADLHLLNHHPEMIAKKYLEVLSNAVKH